jgi:hypothetical protein
MLTPQATQRAGVLDLLHDILVVHERSLTDRLIDDDESDVRLVSLAMSESQY